ncbi:hypothetical protein NE857_04215 [Nocardiopsis exhalans]|uniref:Uncharacterized protein n=1 Tax=Nocardiopsis exhalans TaxID=163604 RepID=A0ABY5D939_9ACTN|nr:hypothetical protein [Nocardiopsis exhalans]USY20866.1 hypothetical protein NE857_04215 [Nocardiopsis exhalans]
MKFEFILDQEGDTPPTPDPQHAEKQGDPAEQTEIQPPSPAALIATAAERMHTRARTDFHRVRSSLNQMLHTVETSAVQPDLTFAACAPEPGVDIFRPEAFGGGRG